MRHPTRRRRQLAGLIKKAGIWLFIAVFVVSIVGGVVLVTISAR